MLLSPVCKRRSRSLCSNCFQNQSASMVWSPNWKAVLLDIRTISSPSTSKHPIHALSVQPVFFNFICLFCLWEDELLNMNLYVVTLAWRPNKTHGNCLSPSLCMSWGLDLGCPSWTQAQLPTEVFLLLYWACVFVNVCIIISSCSQEGVSVYYNQLLLPGRSEEGNMGHDWKASIVLSSHEQMKSSSRTQSIFLFLLGKELLLPLGDIYPLLSLCSIFILCESSGVIQSVEYCIYNELFMEENATQTEMVAILLGEGLRMKYHLVG